jgi:hypothetical protein
MMNDNQRCAVCGLYKQVPFGAGDCFQEDHCAGHVKEDDEDPHAAAMYALAQECGWSKVSSKPPVEYIREKMVSKWIPVSERLSADNCMMTRNQILHLIVQLVADFNNSYGVKKRNRILASIEALMIVLGIFKPGVAFEYKKKIRTERVLFWTSTVEDRETYGEMMYRILEETPGFLEMKARVLKLGRWLTPEEIESFTVEKS